MGTIAPVAAGGVIEFNSEEGFDLYDGQSAGGVVIGVGLVVGPSLGHFYSREPGRAWMGVGIRSAALGLYLAEVYGDVGKGSSGSNVLGTVGLLALMGSAIHDMATAGRSAVEHNRARRTESGVRLEPRIDFAYRGARLGARLGF